VLLNLIVQVKEAHELLQPVAACSLVPVLYAGTLQGRGLRGAPQLVLDLRTKKSIQYTTDARSHQTVTNTYTVSSDPATSGMLDVLNLHNQYDA
jgi:hypothetical protein